MSFDLWDGCLTSPDGSTDSSDEELREERLNTINKTLQSFTQQKRHTFLFEVFERN